MYGRFTFFGIPAFFWNDVEFILPSKGYALFALLAAEPGNVLSRSRLCDVLWGDFEPTRANGNLRQTLARIRKLELKIGAELVFSDSRALKLNTAVLNTDLGGFLAYDWNEHPAIVDQAAVDLVVGLAVREFLTGLDFYEPAFEEWRTKTADRVKRIARNSLLSLVSESAVRVSSDQRMALAQRLLDIDRTSEPAYRALMEIYDDRGEPALALEAYNACRAALRTELGVDPDAVTRRLARSIGFADPPSVTGSSSGVSLTGPASTALRPEVRESGIPKVLVLPPAIAFENPDIQRISAALMEDIIAGLSRFRSFSVFAPHTSLVLTQFGSRGTSRPGFDVHYQVNSSIAPSQSGLRANFRLMRGDDGKVIWSIERAFELDKLPVLFSGVCHQIIYSIAEAVEVADRHLPFAARDASAYRCYLEGRNAMAGTGLEGLRAARRWFRRSLELTSNFAPSIAGISRTLTMEKLVRGITDDEMLRQALALADQACATDPFDGRGLRERGFTSLYLKRHDESLESFRDAVAINPNDADLFADYADALTHSGKSQEALAAFSKAMALNPFCPDYYHWILGSIYFQTEDYPAAIAALRPVCGHPETARLLAACHAMNGQLEEARSYAAILKENYPRFRVEEIMHIVPDKLESDISRLTEGLRRAGMT